MTYTVDLLPYDEGATDAHGNPAPGYGDPVPLEVTSIAPRTSSEPDAEKRSAVVVGISLHVPDASHVGPHDRVIYNGKTYEVDGEVANWNTGPFGYTPGYVVNLKRPEG